MMEGAVVQFIECHKWCGCLGIICEEKSDADRYMIGVPIPQQGVAYIFAKASEFERIGRAALVLTDPCR